MGVVIEKSFSQRPCVPSPVWGWGVRVLVLVIVVVATVTLAGCGIAPATAVAVVSAAGLAAVEIAAKLLAPTPIRGRAQ
ncbi:hypothetical protein AWN90_25090 [Nocardia terpenica]|uniref:Uncharacterized protein n=1 Tax=Nocardia terpenica TaxID=455432 RepID=A0A164NH99_9NOCA|nr:hypothetical protein AWN90_25090 [Nocardia terpenica]